MVLVTGGAGVVGSRLVKSLIEKGSEVRVLALPGDGAADRVKKLGAEVWLGDVSDPKTIFGICKGVDTVYHLAAIIIAQDDRHYDRINAGGTAHIVAEAVRESVGHFILVSSASVIYPKPTTYSLSKKKAEDIVVKSGLNYTIVRPTLVVEKNGGQEFLMFLDYLRKFWVVPFVGSGAALKRPVFTDDVMNGLLLLLNNKITYNKVYNFSGAESISIYNFAKFCLILTGQEYKPVIRIPVRICMVLSEMLKMCLKNPPLNWQVIAGMTQDADLDPQDAIDDLGYQPRRVSEFLPKCIQQ